MYYAIDIEACSSGSPSNTSFVLQGQFADAILAIKNFLLNEKQPEGDYDINIYAHEELPYEIPLLTEISDETQCDLQNDVQLFMAATKTAACVDLFTDNPVILRSIDRAQKTWELKFIKRVSSQT